MKRPIILLLLFSILLGSFPRISIASAPPNLSEKIDAFLGEHKEAVPGAAFAVFTAGQTLDSRVVGYENKEDQIPVTKDSVFDWGSVSKILVWVSLMQLSEQGMLSLEDDIRPHLPQELLRRFRYDAPVRYLDLMHHSAGFEDQVIELFVPFGSEISTLEEALVKRAPTQVFPPGTVVSYSNCGTALAAYLVEQHTGMDYADYVHERIFAPLGMVETALRPDLSDRPDVLRRRLAHRGYSPQGSYLPDALMSIPLYPSGMAVGTLADFQLFAQELLAPQRLFLRPQTADLFFSPSIYYDEHGEPRNSHGLWHYSFVSSVIGHGGNTAGGSSHLLLDHTSGLGIVIFTNQQGETVFNNHLPEVIFGSFEDSPRYHQQRDLPDFFVTSARAVFTGPISLMSAMFNKVDPRTKDALWGYTEEGGIPRLQTAYTDQLRLSFGEIAIRALALGILIGGTLYAFVSLLGSVFMRYRKKKKLKVKNMSPLPSPWGRWNTVGRILLLLLPLDLILLFGQIILFQSLHMYSWQVVLSFILLVLMAALLLGYFLLRKNPASRAEAMVSAMTFFFLAGLLAVGVYYQMYAFWAL